MTHGDDHPPRGAVQVPPAPERPIREHLVATGSTREHGGARRGVGFRHRREGNPPVNRFLNRFGPLSGAASMILGFVGWMAVAGMPPEVATSSTAEVVDFWTDLGDTGRWAS